MARGKHARVGANTRSMRALRDDRGRLQNKRDLEDWGNYGKGEKTRSAQSIEATASFTYPGHSDTRINSPMAAGAFDHPSRRLMSSSEVRFVELHLQDSFPNANPIVNEESFLPS